MRRLNPSRATLTALVLLATAFSGAWLLAQQENAGEAQVYVVRLRDDAVIGHLRRMTPAVRRMELHQGEAARYRAMLLTRQAGLKRRVEALGNTAVRAQMDTVFNGFTVRLRAEDVAAVASLPEVAAVTPSIRYRKLLDAALPLVQVPAAWTDPRVGGESNAGAGIKIGVIDTGMDINHPMLQDGSLSPPAGYPRFTLPTLACPASDQAFTNSKVVVARNYVSLLIFPDPNCDAVDRDGHGTFVGAIAAGRRAQAPLASITGVAPKAFLGSYKVFGTPGFNDDTTLEPLLKAIDDAVKDGMDILSLSVGADDPPPPSLDPLALAVSAAVDAGVTVAVSAGNSGPGPGTITSPATAPTAIAVGATTNSRLLAHPVFVTGASTGPQELQAIPSVISNGPALTFNVGPARITNVSALEASGEACSALPAASLTGRIAFIRRGECSFQTKILNAFLAGAGAVVIYNNQPGQAAFSMAVGFATQIPSVMIGNAEGVALAQYLAAAGTSAQATLGAQQQAFVTTPNQVASFSSAGPGANFSFIEPSNHVTIKPDLVAPGTNIYSAAQRDFPDGEGYSASGFLTATGTSFSTPMVAGAAALLKKAFPAFTAAQVKSALVHSAARITSPAPDGIAGVLSSGNGLLDVAAALNTPATVVPASISFGVIAPGTALNSTVNLSVTNVTTAAETFTAVATAAAGSVPLSVTITPSSFAMASGATTVVTIHAATPQALAGTVEGAIELRSQSTGRTLTIPYWGAVQPRVNYNGMVNAASFGSGPARVAAGSLISIFGSQLTPGGTAHAGAIPLPTALAGTRVRINLVDAPLLFVSPTQINVQVPTELSGSTLGVVQVITSGIIADAPLLLELAPTGPGIFTVDQSGNGRGAILHAATHAPVTPENPARRGEILEVYVNGLGTTTPAFNTNEAAPSNPPAATNFLATALLGGVLAPVRFAGLAPTFVGLNQVNIEVPTNAPTGEVLLILQSNGVVSNAVTVSIAP